MNGCDVEELQNVHHVQELVRDNLFVYDEFITPREEDMLHEELKTSLEKQSYQFDHWDNVSRISKPVNECCIFYPTSTPPVEDNNQNATHTPTEFPGKIPSLPLASG